MFGEEEQRGVREEEGGHQEDEDHDRAVTFERLSAKKKRSSVRN